MSELHFRKIKETENEMIILKKELNEAKQRYQYKYRNQTYSHNDNRFFFSNIISISRLGINYFMLEHQILPQNNCDRIPFGIIGFKLIF